MRDRAALVSLDARIRRTNWEGGVFNLLIGRRVFVSGMLLPWAVARPGAARAADDKLEKTRLTVAVGAKMSFQNLPLTIADRLGFFAAEGLDVEIQDLGSGLRAQQAVMQNTADVTGGAFEDLVALHVTKHYHRAFVLLGRAPQIAFGVSTRTLPAYNKISDLKGRKIGIAATGASSQLVASLVLARGGLSVHDVGFVETGGVGAALQAVRSGQVDAISHMEPVITMLENKGDVRIVADTRSLKGSQDLFGGAMPATCLYAPAEYLVKNPNTVQAMTNAVVHALKWLQTAGPSDLIKAVPDPYLLGDRGLYLASFVKVREAIALDGLIPEDGVKNALRVLSAMSAAVRDGKPDLDRMFTNDFARKAKDKFRP